MALHEKKNNELEKRNSYDFLFSLSFSLGSSRFCISNRSVKINNFRKIRTTGDRFETLLCTFDEKHKSNVIENLEILKISINQNLF